MMMMMTVMMIMMMMVMMMIMMIIIIIIIIIIIMNSLWKRLWTCCKTVYRMNPYPIRNLTDLSDEPHAITSLPLQNNRKFIGTG